MKRLCPFCGQPYQEPPTHPNFDYCRRIACRKKRRALAKAVFDQIYELPVADGPFLIRRKKRHPNTENRETS